MRKISICLMISSIVVLLLVFGPRHNTAQREGMMALKKAAAIALLLQKKRLRIIPLPLPLPLPLPIPISLNHHTPKHEPWPQHHGGHHGHHGGWSSWPSISHSWHAPTMLESWPEQSWGQSWGDGW